MSANGQSRDPRGAWPRPRRALEKERYSKEPSTDVSRDGAELRAGYPWGGARPRIVHWRPVAHTCCCGDYEPSCQPSIMRVATATTRTGTDAIGWRADRASGTRETSSTTTVSRPTTDPVGRLVTRVYAAGSGRDRNRTRRLPSAPGSSSTCTTRSRPSVRCRGSNSAGRVPSTPACACFWGRAYWPIHLMGWSYTGLGVGASRFGADVMLDLIEGVDMSDAHCGWCARNLCPSTRADQDPRDQYHPEPRLWRRPTGTRGSATLVEDAGSVGLGFDS